RRGAPVALPHLRRNVDDGAALAELRPGAAGALLRDGGYGRDAADRAEVHAGLSASRRCEGEGSRGARGGSGDAEASFAASQPSRESTGVMVVGSRGERGGAEFRHGGCKPENN